MAGLTAEQAAFWDDVGFQAPEPKDGQTKEQAYRQAAGGIIAAFQFDGQGEPDRDTVVAELKRRHGA